MKRLGRYTKKIYDEGADLSRIRECCILLTDEQAQDEKYVNDHHVKDLMDCIRCLGCPAAQSG